jgi:DTW domain-containing protein YfiP
MLACSMIDAIDSRLGVVVLQHPAERGKRSNSGRVAARVLARCELKVVEAGADLSVVERPNTALLFPGGRRADAADLAAVDHVVAIDATWRQARRMRAQLPALARLPSLELPARPLQRRIRRPRRPFESSTAEAIAIALELAGDVAAAGDVRAAYGRLIDRLTEPRRPRGDLIQ